MSKSTMDAKCTKQKNEIKAILESNELTMTQNVKDRVKVLYALTEITPEWENIYESN